MSEIKNNGAPTMKTKGAVGDVYTDISTGAQYKCTGSYGIGGQTEYEWKKLNSTVEKEEPAGPVDVKPEKTEEPEEPIDVEPEEVANEHPVAKEEPIDVKPEEVAVKQPKEETPKQENRNLNQNRNRSNNRPNNRTDYSNKFKG